MYVADVGRRTIVANEQRLDAVAENETDEPRAYFYDEDDVFIIENIGASFEMFEEALALTTRADGCEVETVSVGELHLLPRPGPLRRPARQGGPHDLGDHPELAPAR